MLETLRMRSRPSGRRGPAPTALSGTGDFLIGVVGASHYQPALQDLAGGRTCDGVSLFQKAVLVPEPDNPHDANAVRVDIEGATVGYLARREARAFRTALKETGLGIRRTMCGAWIIGGWDRGGDDIGHFGVRLDFEWPLRRA